MKKFFCIVLVSFMAACSHKVMPPPDLHSKLTENAAQGQKVFMKNCNRCHPGGMAGLGPAIINKPLPFFMIKFQVRSGLGTMPSFHKDHISDDELDDLITYIKVLRSDY